MDRVVEPGVKRRRLVVPVEESSSAAAAAATISNVVDIGGPEKDVSEASVFDVEILDCTICTEPLASPIFQV